MKLSSHSLAVAGGVLGLGGLVAVTVPVCASERPESPPHRTRETVRTSDFVWGDAPLPPRPRAHQEDPTAALISSSLPEMAEGLRPHKMSWNRGEESEAQQRIEKALTQLPQALSYYRGWELDVDLNERIARSGIGYDTKWQDLPALYPILDRLPGMGIRVSGEVMDVGFHHADLYGAMHLMEFVDPRNAEGYSGVFVMSPVPLPAGEYVFEGLIFPSDQDDHTLYVMKATPLHGTASEAGSVELSEEQRQLIEQLEALVGKKLFSEPEAN